MKAKEILRKSWIVFVLITLVVIFSFGNSAFFTGSNLMNIIRQVSMLVIVCVGMTFVLIAGGIDLSVGSQISIVGVVTATLLSNGVNPGLACVIGIGLSTLVGVLNGMFIAFTLVPPLIATLGMMQVLQGLGYIISSGKNIYGLPDSIKFIGQGYLSFLPIPVIIAIVLTIVGMFILNKTYTGRYFYAIGSNAEVSRLSGIKVKMVKTISFGLCGLFTGIAGIIMMARVNSGSPIVGRGFEMDVLTAAVLGGVSVNGGEGKLSGAVIGALIIGVLSNGLIIMNVSEYYQMVIKGMVLILAITFDSLSNKKYQANAA